MTFLFIYFIYLFSTCFSWKGNFFHTKPLRTVLSAIIFKFFSNALKIPWRLELWKKVLFFGLKKLFFKTLFPAINCKHLKNFSPSGANQLGTVPPSLTRSITAMNFWKSRPLSSSSASTVAGAYGALNSSSSFALKLKS